MSFEDPFFVADFLVDVVRHRAAQPGQAFRQAPAEAHQQGRGVAHVVVGLAEEGQVAVARDAALQAVGDDRCRQQLGSRFLGGGDQLFIKRHRDIPHWRSSAVIADA
jgi:hypothetical protein